MPLLPWASYQEERMGARPSEMVLQRLPKVLLFPYRHDTEFLQAEARPDPEDCFHALRRSSLPSGGTSGQCLRPDRMSVEKETSGAYEKPGKDGAFRENMGGSCLYPCPGQGKIEGEEERAVEQYETDCPCHR